MKIVHFNCKCVVFDTLTLTHTHTHIDTIWRWKNSTQHSYNSISNAWIRLLNKLNFFSSRLPLCRFSKKYNVFFSCRLFFGIVRTIIYSINNDDDDDDGNQRFLSQKKIVKTLYVPMYPKRVNRLHRLSLSVVNEKLFFVRFISFLGN